MAVEADVKALEKRVKYLEDLVKALVAARSESKAEATKMLAEATKVFEQKTTKAVAGVLDAKRSDGGVSPQEFRKLQEASEKKLMAVQEMRLKANKDEIKGAIAQQRTEADKQAAAALAAVQAG